MKSKMKKIVAIVLASTMLMGMTLTANAATKFINCGSYSVATTGPAYGHCYLSSCHAPLYFYACANCKVYWEKCSMGHMQ